MTPISLHSEAASEMNWAATYYESHAQGLGQAFLDELQKAFAQIAEMPEANVRIGTRLRKKALLRFPYTIIYALQTERIRVLAIAHQKRRPGYWQHRQQGL